MSWIWACSRAEDAHHQLDSPIRAMDGFSCSTHLVSWPVAAVPR
jgi:hypothetical protein